MSKTLNNIKKETQTLQENSEASNFVNANIESEISSIAQAKSIIKQAKQMKINTQSSKTEIENKAIRNNTMNGGMMNNTMNSNNMVDTNMAHRVETLERTIRLMNSGIGSNDPSDDGAVEATRMSSDMNALRAYMRDGNVQSKSLNYDNAQGGALLPVNVSGKIIELVKEICPLMNHASIYGTKSKEISFSINTSTDQTAMWHNAWKGADKKDTFTPKLDQKKVSLHTCLAVVDVDRDFMEDIGNDVLAWMESRVSSDFSSQINMAMLEGDGIHMPKGIFADGNFNAIKGANSERAVKIESRASVRGADGAAGAAAGTSEINYVEVLLEMLGKMSDEFLTDARWYVSQEFFSKLISAMSKQTGEAAIYKHLQPGATDSGATYMLFGKPVHVVKGMDSAGVKAKKCPIMLANLKSGYYFAKHPEVRFTQRLEGDAENVRFLYRMRIGGDVANPNAFVLGLTA